MSDNLITAALRAAIINQRIYPTGSPIVERSVGQILAAIEAALNSKEKLSLTVKDGKLYLRGKETPDGDMLLPFFEEQEIQSITFVPGVTSPEISRLVALLSRKRGDEPIADWLKKEGVTHLLIDKSSIVEVMEGDVVMKKVDQLFADCQDFPSLVAALRESYDMADKLPDGDDRVQVQEHMARRLAGMPPHLLRDVFENELPKRVEESGLRSMVMNAMTQDQIQDIFSEIGQWYKQMKAESSSEFEVVEHLNKLRSFLGKLLNAPASKGVPFSLYEELLQNGLLDKIPSDVKQQTEEESLAVRVDQILSRAAAALLEQPLRDQLTPMLRKLCAVGLDDMIQKLVEKVLENFGQGTALVRQLSARTAAGFMDILWASRRHKLFRFIVSALETLAESERSAEVYQEAAQGLARAAGRFILEREMADARRLIVLLARHQEDDTSLAPKRKQQATEALGQIAEGSIDVLTEDMLSEDPDKRDQARAVLAMFGEGAVTCLVKVIRCSPDLRARRVAAELLKQSGEKAKARLAVEIHPGTPTDMLLRLLSVVDDLSAPPLLASFRSVSAFPDAAVRRRVIQVAAKTPTPEAALLLCGFLDDGDDVVAVDALRAVGEAKVQSAVPKLLEILKNGNMAKMEEACLALGRLAAPNALPILSEIIEPKAGGLFKKKAAVEETVRVRAAWAVAQIPSAEAKDILRKLLSDPNLQIQSIARQALGGA